MRQTVILDREQTSRLLPMDACIDVMEDVFRTAAAGGAFNPLRDIMRIPGREGLLGLMPGALTEPPVAGLKAVSVFPGNHAAGLESHQGWVLLFETRHGSPTALVDAAAITAIRTAAVSGLASRILALPDASTLGLLGTGVQAESHLEAMAVVRPLRRVRVWSPDPEHVENFCRRYESAEFSVEAADSARRAVEGAHLICTVTAAASPVLEGDWLSPGAHVNAVGACFPTARELDGEAVARCRLFTDSVESLMNEAGDFLLAREEGAVDDAHVLGELKDLVVDPSRGRTSRSDVTLFKSLGLAIEDLASAHYVYRRALEMDVEGRV